jgi:REP-associated tyrosine transposase
LQEARGYEVEEFSKHERTGRPLGDDGFIEMAEKLLKRDLKKKRPGRNPKGED